MTLVLEVARQLRRLARRQSEHQLSPQWQHLLKSAPRMLVPVVMTSTGSKQLNHGGLCVLPKDSQEVLAPLAVRGRLVVLWAV